MLGELLWAALLLALTVTAHALILSVILIRVDRKRDAQPAGLLRSTRELVRITALIVLAHVGEIILWGGFFYWKGLLPSLEISCYFSAVTYATIGYGDVVLPEGWRLL